MNHLSALPAFAEPALLFSSGLLGLAELSQESPWAPEARWGRDWVLTNLVEVRSC